LAKEPPGTYLLRFSGSDPGSYAISAKSRSGATRHYRVYHKPDLEYLMYGVIRIVLLCLLSVYERERECVCVGTNICMRVCVRTHVYYMCETCSFAYAHPILSRAL
jgi:SH2 domain